MIKLVLPTETLSFYQIVRLCAGKNAKGRYTESDAKSWLVPVTLMLRCTAIP
jgi:hypothetical protein